MGHGTRGGALGHTIRTFWPDDDENTMHFSTDSRTTLGEILFKAMEKWPGTPIEQIQISAQKIQTDCLGYDLYDPMDHTDFIILTKTN